MPSFPTRSGRAGRRPRSTDEVLPRAAARELKVVHALCQAVSVGETYFFRHPEHFRWMAATFLPELLNARAEFPSARGARAARRRGSVLHRGVPARSDALAAHRLPRGPGDRPARAQPRRGARRRIRGMVAAALRPRAASDLQGYRERPRPIDDAVRAVTRFGEHTCSRNRPASSI